MSLSATLANALSGLTAAARRAEVVSSNVSNAMTPGYARRELELSSMSLGGNGAGVKVDGVSRALNRLVLTDRRLADAEAGNAGARTDFLSGIEKTLGQPGESGSLDGLYAAFDAALVQAASRPDSQARLQSVLGAAQNLAGKFNTIGATIQQARMDADGTLAREVEDLNSALARIDELNADILAQRSSGRDATALMDQRQRLVDRVSEIVPVREVARDHDQIALFTTGGAILLDGNPARVGFAPASYISADMTLAGGDLSGLTVNGMAVSSGDGGVLGGGTLGAALAVRDELAPGLQVQIDALARDLVERFSAPAADPTLPPGLPGLFTDGGSSFDPSTEPGLAGRIAVNALADPSRGGALWRLRDGLGAAAAGDVGRAAILQSMADALAAQRVPASGNFVGAGRSGAGLAADVLSQVADGRQTSEIRQTQAAARQSAMTELHLQDGVDTDTELQTLLMVEQAYSANARVVQTIDSLIQQLIGL